MHQRLGWGLDRILCHVASDLVRHGKTAGISRALHTTRLGRDYYDYFER